MELFEVVRTGMRMVEVLSVKHRGLSEHRYAECTTEAKEHTKHAKHPGWPLELTDRTPKTCEDLVQ